MMMRSFVVAALMMVSLTACGDDDKDKDDVLTGKVSDWTVSGMHYATSTQAGLTSSTGEFKYKSGESVTFAIGGTTIAAVTGAESITLFGMFGIAPPTSELEIRSLRRVGTIQPFDRVANTATLLFALDVDHDPTNGIDLADWDTKLANETMSLEVKAVEFAFRQVDRLGAAYAGVYRTPAEPAIVMLYDTLGIRVSAHAIATQVLALGGVNSSRETYSYDARGRDVVLREDDDFDGLDDYVRTSSFNAAGQFVSGVVDEDDDDNGSLETRNTNESTWGPLGVELTSFTTVAVDGVSVLRRGRTFTYDERGNAMLEVFRSDSGVDGTIEGFEDVTYTRDARGLMLTQVTEARGTDAGPVTRRTSSRYTYDAAGRLTSETEEPDYDANGVADSSFTRVLTYDAAGRVLTSAREFRDATGALTSRTVNTTTYDAAGHPTLEVYESDGDANGAVDNRKTTTTTYTPAGQPATVTFDDDVGGNNTIDSRSVRTLTYTAEGLLQQITSQTDDGVNGSIESSSNEQWVFDPSGAILTSTYTDNESLGGPRGVTNTLTVIEDGLLYLLGERIVGGTVGAAD